MTITERHRFRLDQDRVRQPRPGRRDHQRRPGRAGQDHPNGDHGRNAFPRRCAPSSRTFPPPGGPRGDSQAPDERRTSAPSRRAPADDQPGRPRPAPDPVHLAGLTAPPIAGTCTRRLRGGRSPVGRYPLHRRRLKGKRLRRRLRRPLTRRRLRGSRDTGRPGRARSTRQATANSSGQGAIDPQQEDQRPLTGGQHGWRINKTDRWRGWADPDVGMPLSPEEVLEGVRDGRDFGKRRRDLDRDG